MRQVFTTQGTGIQNRKYRRFRNNILIPIVIVIKRFAQCQEQDFIKGDNAKEKEHRNIVVSAVSLESVIIRTV